MVLNTDGGKRNCHIFNNSNKNDLEARKLGLNELKLRIVETITGDNYRMQMN